MDARTAFVEQQAETKRCEENEKEADTTRQSAEVGAAVLAKQMENAREAHRQALQLLAEAREDQSDTDLDEAVTAQQNRADAAAAALQEGEEELATQDPDSLEARLSNARNAKVRAETDLRNNQDRQQELRGKLEAHGEAGLHSELNRERNRCSQLARDHEQIEARAQAALLLYETFERRRLEAHQRYVAPFEDKIKQLGRIVFGTSFEVELDAELRVVSRTLDGITLNFDQLQRGCS